MARTIDPELDYPKWKPLRLARRVLLYSGYVGCGCSNGEHDKKSDGCARADFVRLAAELIKRSRRQVALG